MTLAHTSNVSFRNIKYRSYAINPTRSRKTSFGLGHSIQGKNKPWGKRYVRPFSPEDKNEAIKIVREIFNLSGLPPVEYILNILNKKGGSP
jgi:hypothetical protein